MYLVFVCMFVYIFYIGICWSDINEIFIEFINKRVWVEGGIIGVIMLMFIVIVF